VDFAGLGGFCWTWWILLDLMDFARFGRLAGFAGLARIYRNMQIYKYYLQFYKKSFHFATANSQKKFVF